MLSEELQKFKKALEVKYQDNLSYEEILLVTLSALFNQVDCKSLRNIEIAFLLWLCQFNPKQIFSLLEFLNDELKTAKL